MNILKILAHVITTLEADRDYTDQPFSAEQERFLAVLNLCYDLLTRTETAQNSNVADDGDIIHYAINANTLADFAFSITTQQGEVDMRELLSVIIRRSNDTQKEIAAGAGIRPNTIGDYLNGKKGLTIRSYEKILNYILKK